MNKAELIHAIADKTGLTKADTEKTLNALVETVMDTVADGQEVILIGFGTFKPAHRAAREGRNPATGATIQIEASVQPKFLPGAAFKQRVKGSS
jgi:DNA-binding protein HU-beta